MEIVTISRRCVIERTAQNLIEAQIAKPEEYGLVVSALSELGTEDLLIALTGSEKFRAECKEPIKFYPIILPIGSN